MDKTLPYLVQKNVVEFVERHIDPEDMEEFYGITGEPDQEIKFVCPFCSGGNRRRKCFDLNITKGVARCWRADSCGWRGSVYKFASDLTGITTKEAWHLFQTNDYDPNSLVAAVHSAMRVREHQRESTNIEFPVDAFPSIPLSESPIKSKVYKWIERRGFDPEWFDANCHIFAPDKGLSLSDEYHSRGRVVFNVESLDGCGFQLYTYDSDLQSLKTHNPEGKVLSRLLYNYNDTLDDDYVLFITEGIFDAARIKSYNLSSVCIFGVVIHPMQIYLIEQSNVEEICICLDNGTYKESMEILNLLEQSTSKKISYMNLKGKGEDPDNISFDKFERYFEERQVFDRNSKSVENMLKELSLKYL